MGRFLDVSIIELAMRLKAISSNSATGLDLIYSDSENRKKKSTASKYLLVEITTSSHRVTIWIGNDSKSKELLTTLRLNADFNLTTEMIICLSLFFSLRHFCFRSMI